MPFQSLVSLFRLPMREPVSGAVLWPVSWELDWEPSNSFHIVHWKNTCLTDLLFANGASDAYNHNTYLCVYHSGKTNRNYLLVEFIRRKTFCSSAHLFCYSPVTGRATVPTFSPVLCFVSQQRCLIIYRRTDCLLFRELSLLLWTGQFLLEVFVKTFI